MNQIESTKPASSHCAMWASCLNADDILKDCGEYFDPSESISDCLARQRLKI